MKRASKLRQRERVIDPSLAISPVVGVDLSSFLTQKTQSSGALDNVDGRRANTFLFAGVQGRFDAVAGPSEVK